jgi:hypothetical protein
MARFYGALARDGTTEAAQRVKALSTRYGIVRYGIVVPN